MRSLRDYQKVRRFLGWLLRNRRFQAARPQLAARDYLQVGCGPRIAPGFINLDYRWVPGVDVVWDLNRPLPFPNSRFDGMFTEHCLEHFAVDRLAVLLTEANRVLRPGGIIRIVVPSLELHAQRYLSAHTDEDDGPARAFNRVIYAGHEDQQRSRWANDAHHFLHDFASLAAALRAAGFQKITRAEFGRGSDPRLLIDRADRAWESLYVEATKTTTLEP
ncbi:MAG TPA: methyltransferase domain-containing protein [Lacunisphaera sp.]|nr:methyltransferase domain-containing protein [Lacunisphaera sp.]